MRRTQNRPHGIAYPTVIGGQIDMRGTAGQNRERDKVILVQPIDEGPNSIEDKVTVARGNLLDVGDKDEDSPLWRKIIDARRWDLRGSLSGRTRRRGDVLNGLHPSWCSSHRNDKVVAVEANQR
jgi:hypothetical protein